MANQLVCPHCGGTLALPTAAVPGALVRCPLCQRTFTVQPAGAVAPTPSNPRPSAANPATAPRRSAPRAAAASNGAPRSAAAGGGLRLVVGGLALAVVALLMLGGLALLFWRNVLAERPADKQAGTQVAATEGPIPEPIADTPAPPATTAQDPAQAKPPVPDVPMKKDTSAAAKDGGPDIADLPKPEPPPVTPLPTAPPAKEPPPKGVTPPPESVKPPPESVKRPPGPEVAITVPGSPAVPGVDAAHIKDAITKGVQFMKTRLGPTGAFDPAMSLGHRTGHAALAALALLECDVPASDPAMQSVFRHIRGNAEQLDQVYSLSIAILALDRLGDQRDRPLIRHLSARLVAAQWSDFAWSYSAQILAPPTEQQVIALLRTHWPWSAAQPRPDGALKSAKGKQLKLPRVDLANLPPGELKWNRWDQSRTGRSLEHAVRPAGGVGPRRHGVPVECPILASYKHYVDAADRRRLALFRRRELQGYDDLFGAARPGHGSRRPARSSRRARQRQAGPAARSRHRQGPGVPGPLRRHAGGGREGAAAAAESVPALVDRAQWQCFTTSRPSTARIGTAGARGAVGQSESRWLVGQRRRTRVPTRWRTPASRCCS